MPTHYCRTEATPPCGGAVSGEHLLVNIEDDSPCEHLTPEMKELADDMWKRLIELKPVKMFSIGRVLEPQPANIPANDYDAFNPKGVSIGPLHRGDPQLKLMEPLKWLLLAGLLGVSPSDPATDGLPRLKAMVKAIWMLDGPVREQYAEDISLSTRELVQMLVLDGCYILQMLEDTPQFNEQSPGYNLAFSIMRNDLILLENQIPFFVLETHSVLRGKPKDYVRGKALDLLVRSDEHRKKVNELIDGGNQPAHLLHLVLLSCIPPPKSSNPQQISGKGRRKKGTFAATELYTKGVKFRISDSDSILDVRFDGGTGELWIPQLLINRVNMSLFRNLVAFEQLLLSAEGHFTGYAVFMDNIINTAEDVRLLGRSGVVKNYLATDKEAAQFFNTLYQDVTEDRQQNTYYTDIARDIDQYCAARHHGWWVKLKDDYFGSPWSGISVVAAVFALFLSAVQAYFSAFGSA